jgi:hypothetical protein
MRQLISNRYWQDDVTELINPSVNDVETNARFARPDVPDNPPKGGASVPFWHTYAKEPIKFPVDEAFPVSKQEF